MKGFGAKKSSVRTSMIEIVMQLQKYFEPQCASDQAALPRSQEGG